MPRRRVSPPAPRACLAVWLALFGGPGAALAQTATEPAASPPTEVCGAVRLAVFAWPSAEIAAALLRRLLEDGYGCDVRATPAAPDRVLAAIRAPEPDAPPLVATALSRSVVEAVAAPARGAAAEQPAPQIRIGAALFQARERAGWFVPAWFAAANPRVRTLADAVAAAALFAETKGAKPVLTLCPAHWACAAENRALVAELGAAARFRIVEPASGDALRASVEAAARARRPWIGYLWTPSAATARTPMVRLETGAARICAAIGRCRPPFDAAPLVSAYQAALAARAPRAAGLLDRFEIPPDRMREALALRAESGASAAQAAEAILATAPALLSTWLDAPARRRFAQAVEDRKAAAAQGAAGAKPPAAPRP